MDKQKTLSNGLVYYEIGFGTWRLGAGAKTTETVLNAIKFYCRSIFDALNEGDNSLIQFYSL